MIPVVDLQRQYDSIREEVEDAIRTVFSRGRFILGNEVAAFEREFATHCGIDHAVGTGSGTEALHLALAACGIGPGDEVITVSHTAVATVAAIELTGARPVFVDIDAQRYTLDPGRLEHAVTARTRAVVPVHIYGCPADVSPILKIAGKHSLLVVEDCAQAHGAMYRGKMVGTWGHAGVFSFYPTKNLGAYGDAGALVTGDAALAERARLLREYGWQERHISIVRGTNSRLDELQAGILRVKLRHLEAWNRRRRELAHRYGSLLAGIGIRLPQIPAGSKHAYHLYVVRHPRRDDIRAFLETRGIGTGVHYPIPLHLQPAYLDLDYPAGSLPETESAAGEVLSLPVFPELRNDEVDAVAAAVIEWAASMVDGRQQ